MLMLRSHKSFVGDAVFYFEKLKHAAILQWVAGSLLASSFFTGKISSILALTLLSVNIRFYSS